MNMQLEFSRVTTISAYNKIKVEKELVTVEKAGKVTKFPTSDLVYLNPSAKKIVFNRSIRTKVEAAELTVFSGKVMSDGEVYVNSEYLKMSASKVDEAPAESKKKKKKKSEK